MKFKVKVTRTEQREMVFTVDCDNAKQAKEMALNAAGNYDFSNVCSIDVQYNAEVQKENIPN